MICLHEAGLPALAQDIDCPGHTGKIFEGRAARKRMIDRTELGRFVDVHPTVLAVRRRKQITYWVQMHNSTIRLMRNVLMHYVPSYVASSCFDGE